MDLRAVLARTQRGLRDDLRLHAVAIISLIVAFLCLGTALLSIENLRRIAERWGRTQHLTVYLRADASDSDVAQLRLAIEGLDEVGKVEHVTAARARELFAEQSDLQQQVQNLPADVFPPSLELELASRVDERRIDKLVQRLRQFEAVDDVETYRSFVGQFQTLLQAGYSGALLLAWLVVVCVLAVIGNTIRVAVANRRREIEVLKLCGATDAFVRGPFLVEGVVQAVASATLAMLLLLFAYLLLRTRIEATVSALTGVSSVFLSPVTVAAVILAAGAMGGLGSAWSLRRYLHV
ncbi:MAG: permease-like cell division protein FtsX [Polyangiales bacterium]